MGAYCLDHSCERIRLVDSKSHVNRTENVRPSTNQQQRCQAPLRASAHKLDRLLFHELQQRLLSRVQLSTAITQQFVQRVEMTIDDPACLETVDDLGTDV